MKPCCTFRKGRPRRKEVEAGNVGLHFFPFILVLGMHEVESRRLFNILIRKMQLSHPWSLEPVLCDSIVCPG